MKKFTFLAAFAFAMSMSAGAQVVAWEDKLTTVEQASDFVLSAPMAVDADGNTVVTGRYSLQGNLQFGLYTFTGITANDAFIAKYDKKGQKQWVAGINGNALITAVTTDADGNIYAAGKFAAEVKVQGTSGQPMDLSDGNPENTERTSSFVVKYDKDGVVKAVQSFISSSDVSIVTGDMMAMFEPTCAIGNIEVDGGKVYVSLLYRGTAKNSDITLEGNYTTAWGFLVQDINTAAVVSLNASDLGASTCIAKFGAAEKVLSDLSYQPESVNFTVDNGVVYAGFVGSGTLALTTASGSENIALSYQETGKEHAFIFSRIEGNNTITKVYHSTDTLDNLNNLNFINKMQLIDGKLYAIGTLNVTGLFGGLDYKGGCDMYVASLNPVDLSLNAAKTTAYNEGEANKMAEVFATLCEAAPSTWLLAGYTKQTANDSIVINTLQYFVNLKTCELTLTNESSDQNSLATSASNNNYVVLQFSDSVTYNYYALVFESSSLDKVAAGQGLTMRRNGETIILSAPADINVYNINGTLVKAAKAATSLSLADLGKGMYIIKAGQKAIKFNKY